MSAYEQRVETPDRHWQYLLFAAAPYETVAFKIPAAEIDRDPSRCVLGEGGGRVTALPHLTPATAPPTRPLHCCPFACRFYTHWDADRKTFTLQLHFKATPPAHGGSSSSGGAAAAVGGAGLGGGLLPPAAAAAAPAYGVAR